MKIKYIDSIEGAVEYINSLANPPYKIVDPEGATVHICRALNSQAAWESFAGGRHQALALMAKGWRLYQLEDTE